MAVLEGRDRAAIEDEVSRRLLGSANGPNDAAPEIREIVIACTDRFADATVHAFLPVIIEREARRLLRARVR